MASFISKHIEQISDPLQVVRDVDRIIERPYVTFPWLKTLAPDKKKRFDEFVDLIKMHMPALLQDAFTPDKLQPVEENKTWDNYVSSIYNIAGKRTSPNMIKLVSARNDLVDEYSNKGQFSVQGIQELKNQFTKFLEVGIVSGGLLTAFQNIYGLLRVIPILVERAGGEFVNKTELIARITDKATQKLLKKIMVLNSVTMSALINILWQKPVRSEAEAKEKFDCYEEIYDLALLSVHSPTTRLYHPGNFELTEGGGIDFNASGKYYYEAAEKLKIEEKTGGCPAIQVDRAIEGVCNLVGKIINLIPDERFKELIEAPRTSYETIRRQVNSDMDVAVRDRERLRLSQDF